MNGICLKVEITLNTLQLVPSPFSNLFCQIKDNISLTLAAYAVSMFTVDSGVQDGGAEGHVPPENDLLRALNGETDILTHFLRIEGASV